MKNQNDRAIRRKKRKIKKRQQSIAVLTILMMLISAGVVHAQIQGYEIFYQGESLGFVNSAKIFEKAISQIEEEYQVCFDNEDIVLGEGFEMVSSRIDQSMDFKEWINKIKDKNIELYVNGMIVLCDNQVIGNAASSSEAERIKSSYELIYPLKDELVFINTRIPLSKTSDFETIFLGIQRLKSE